MSHDTNLISGLFLGEHFYQLFSCFLEASQGRQQRKRWLITGSAAVDGGGVHLESLVSASGLNELVEYLSEWISEKGK